MEAVTPGKSTSMSVGPGARLIAPAASFGLASVMGLALTAAASLSGGDGRVTLVVGLAGPLMALIIGGLLQARGGTDPAWVSRVAAWILGSA